MEADIIKLADDLKTLIESKPEFIGYTVEVPDIVDQRVEEITGKNVYIFPMTYGSSGPSDRESDYYELMINVLYTEKYDLPGKIPRQWTRDRMAFVEQNLFNLLGDNRTRYGEDSAYWSSEGSVTTLFDREALRDFNLFWSELELVYRKLK